MSLPLAGYCSKWRVGRPLVVKSALDNIWDNLALESLLSKRAAGALGHSRSNKLPLLYLWRNRPCVVIGRNQNAFSECDLDKINRDGVHLARRHTGGGAVYHDEGNTLFTFIHQKRSLDRSFGNKVILGALKKDFAIDAEVSGRNDLTIKGKKFSGSAYRLGADQFLHHGTLMVNVNLDKLGEYLTPHPLKLKQEKGGTKSVKSRVVNLKQFNSKINHEKLSNSLVSQFSRETTGKSQQVNLLDVDKTHPLVHDSEFVEASDKLRSRQWLYGTVPPFQMSFVRKLDFGILELRLDIDAGVVRDIQLFTDAMDENILEKLRGIFRRPLIGMAVCELDSIRAESLIDWVLYSAMDCCQSTLLSRESP